MNLNDMWVFDIETTDEYVPIRIIKNRNSNWQQYHYVQEYRFCEEGLCAISSPRNRRDHFKKEKELFEI